MSAASLEDQQPPTTLCDDANETSSSSLQSPQDFPSISSILSQRPNLPSNNQTSSNQNGMTSETLLDTSPGKKTSSGGQSKVSKLKMLWEENIRNNQPQTSSGTRSDPTLVTLKSSPSSLEIPPSRKWATFNSQQPKPLFNQEQLQSKRNERITIQQTTEVRSGTIDIKVSSIGDKILTLEKSSEESVTSQPYLSEDSGRPQTSREKNTTEINEETRKKRLSVSETILKFSQHFTKTQLEQEKQEEWLQIRKQSILLKKQQTSPRSDNATPPSDNFDIINVENTDEKSVLTQPKTEIISEVDSIPVDEAKVVEGKENVVLEVQDTSATEELRELTEEKNEHAKEEEKTEQLVPPLEQVESPIEEVSQCEIAIIVKEDETIEIISKESEVNSENNVTKQAEILVATLDQSLDTPKLISQDSDNVVETEPENSPHTTAEIVNTTEESISTDLSIIQTTTSSPSTEDIKPILEIEIVTNNQTDESTSPNCHDTEPLTTIPSSTIHTEETDSATCITYDTISDDETEIESQVKCKQSSLDIIDEEDISVDVQDKQVAKDPRLISGRFMNMIDSPSTNPISLSTISQTLGNAIKDVEIESNEDYSKYFHKTNYKSFQENVVSLLDERRMTQEEETKESSSQKRTLKKNQSKIKLKSKQLQKMVSTYNRNRWIDRILIFSIGSEEFQNMMTSESYVDSNELAIDGYDSVSTNALFEESERTVNPLYEEETVVINNLFEEEYISVNPLFDPTDMDSINSFCNFEDDEKAFVETLKSEIPKQTGSIKSKIKKIYSKAFSGSDLVNWIMSQSDGQFFRQDASYFAQQMMDRMIFKNVDMIQTIFDGSDSSFYIFTEDYESKNTLNINQNKIGVYEPASSSTSIYRTLNEIGKIIKHRYDLGAKYEGAPIFDYQGFVFSEHYPIMVSELAKLSKVDPTQISDPTFRKCFFMNVHNFMVLHALIECGKPTNFLLRKRFFHSKKYVIGRYKLSLDDLSNGILRGEKFKRSISGNLAVENSNTNISGFLQRLLGQDKEHNVLQETIDHLRIPEFDPRVVFCLYRADMSSPRFHIFSYETLDMEIEKASREYIQRETHIDMDSGLISLPKFFLWFKDDYGSNEEAILKYASKYLESDACSKINLLKQTEDGITIQYHYNTSLNIHSNYSLDGNREVKLELTEVISNPKLLPYFESHCENEHSTENIHFFTRVESYKQIADPTMRLEEARKIFDEFLTLHSEKELNISQKYIKDVQKELQLCEAASDKVGDDDPKIIGSDLFSPIQVLIETLMIDTYSRFLSSKLYNQVVEVFKEELKQQIEAETPRSQSIFASTSSNETIFDTKSFRELQQMRTYRMSNKDLTSMTTINNTNDSSPSTPVSASTAGSPFTSVTM